MLILQNRFSHVVGIILTVLIDGQLAGLGYDGVIRPVNISLETFLNFMLDEPRCRHLWFT